MTFLAELGTSTFLHGGVYNLQETTQLIPRSDLGEVELLDLDYADMEISAVAASLGEDLSVKPDSDFLFQ